MLLFSLALIIPLLIPQRPILFICFLTFQTIFLDLTCKHLGSLHAVSSKRSSFFSCCPSCNSFLSFSFFLKLVRKVGIEEIQYPQSRGIHGGEGSIVHNLNSTICLILWKSKNLSIKSLFLLRRTHSWEDYKKLKFYCCENQEGRLRNSFCFQSCRRIRSINVGVSVSSNSSVVPSPEQLTVAQDYLGLFYLFSGLRGG